MIQILLHPATIPTIMYFIYTIYKKITKKDEL